MSFPFCLREPSVEQVQRLLQTQQTQSLTYDAVAATREGDAPPGWPARGREVQLGKPFDVAKEQLSRWHQYDLSWTSVPVMPPIEPGQVFATVARTLGVWSINCCRIVYVIDEPDRFGYGIGTLPHHCETGEERFLLTRDGESVTFEISSFSRANHWLVSVGWWYAERSIQRFLRQGTQRMASG